MVTTFDDVWDAYVKVLCQLILVLNVSLSIHSYWLRLCLCRNTQTQNHTESWQCQNYNDLCLIYGNPASDEWCNQDRQDLGCNGVGGILVWQAYKQSQHLLFFFPLFRYLIFSPWAIRYMCSMHLDIYSCAISYMIDCNSILSWRCVKMLSWTKGKKTKRKQVPAASLIWNIVIIEVKRRYLFCFVFLFFQISKWILLFPIFTFF